MIENKNIMVIATTDNMIWQFLIPHINHLISLGNRVECVCAKTGFWFDELKDKFNFKMHEINFKRNPFSFKNYKCFKQLIKLQKQENFNFVYCQQPVGGFMGRLIAKKFKIPCIYTAHGFHFYNGCSFKNKIIFKMVEKWASKYTDVLITINDEDFKAALKLKAKKVYKINGIGIDESKIVNDDFNKIEFKKSLGLNKNDKVILTVSELNKNKNYFTMLNVIKNLIDKDKTIKFVACGKGEWTEKILKYAEKLKIKDHCVFLGFRKDVSKIMMVSDLFLHASFREGLTLSVMEAMSLGLPCVVSDVRGNRDLIDDGKGGFVCKPTNDIKMSDCILKILVDKNLYNKMSNYNIKKSEKYSIKSVIKELDEIYKEFKNDKSGKYKN